jgi:DNA-directed RNA polymerase specialized sigma24 family protein
VDEKGLFNISPQNVAVEISHGLQFERPVLVVPAAVGPLDSVLMPDSQTDSSVNRWLRRLEQGDEIAAETLWVQYFEKLVRVAQGRLQLRYRKATDAEDVALSAFHSFCAGVQQKKFPFLKDRVGLWRLLVSITIHKVLHVVRDQDRIKRGGQMRELQGLEHDSDALHAVNQLISREPSPEFANEIAEQMQVLMVALQDKQLQELAHLKLEGFSNEEIATRMNCSLRTIERKLNLIRKIWVVNGLVDQD